MSEDKKSDSEKIWEEHIEEWTKWSNFYKSEAKNKNIADPLFYRHRCIEGLINKTTYNY